MDHLEDRVDPRMPAAASRAARCCRTVRCRQFQCVWKPHRARSPKVRWPRIESGLAATDGCCDFHRCPEASCAAFELRVDRSTPIVLLADDSENMQPGCSSFAFRCQAARQRGRGLSEPDARRHCSARSRRCTATVARKAT